MSKPKITEVDFERAAKKLRCSVPAIKAVAEVESKGQGFYSDGFPVILFERHKFYKYAKRSVKNKWREYADICNPSSGGYGKAGQNQRNKFNRAFALDAEAAMKSCSWGKFQIMGFNHEVCGFATVGAFVDAMKESEGRHLDAFVGFVIGNGLAKYLRSLDWASFANGYNGSGYKANRYDTKMAAAYKRYLKNSAAEPASGAREPLTETNGVDAPATPSVDAVQPNSAAQPPSPSVDVTITNENNAGEEPPSPEPEDKAVIAPAKDGATASAAKWTIGGIALPGFVVAAIEAVKNAIDNGYINAAEVGATVLTFIRENQRYVFVLIGGIIALQIVKKVFKQVTFLIQLIAAAVPHWNNVIVVPAPVEEPKKWWQVWK